MSSQYSAYDQIDQMIIECIMQDASLTSSQLGQKVGLSASAANERVRRLKQNGVIKKMTALVSADFLDMGLCAFISVSIETIASHEEFLLAIHSNKSILECHHMTGEYSYLLKVRCKDTKELEWLITNFLKGQCNAYKTSTQIVLSSHKEGSSIVE